MSFATGTALLYALVGAVITVYLPFVVVGYGRMKLGYNASAPRTMFEKLPGYAQRATWAHENCFEALSVFTAAALMAYVTGVESSLATGAAIAFVVARVLYSFFYIADLPMARSLMFATGNLCNGILFVLSLLAVS
jgi:uncharacterized MAPEG superfamily protein